MRLKSALRPAVTARFLPDEPVVESEMTAIIRKFLIRRALGTTEPPSNVFCRPEVEAAGIEERPDDWLLLSLLFRTPPYNLLGRRS